MKNQTVIIGDITMDIIANTPSFPLESGKSVLSDFVMFEPGGNANTIIAAQRLGSNTIPVGYLGTDMQGDFSVSCLKEEGVDVSNIVRSGTTTTVITITDGKGHHCFHGKSGVGPVLKASDLKKINFEKTSAVYFTGYTIFDELTRDLCRSAAEYVTAFGGHVVLDPGPQFELLSVEDRNKYLGLADFLLLTQDEISGTGYSSIQSIREMFPRLNIVEKMGGEGCTAYAADGKTEHFAAHKVVVKDTSGAGDSFAGGFLAMLEKGKSFFDCVKVANVVGQCKVQKTGCGRLVPTKKEVEDFIAKNNEEIYL